MKTSSLNGGHFSLHGVHVSDTIISDVELRDSASPLTGEEGSDVIIAEEELDKTQCALFSPIQQSSC
jgi:hypothetical protein